MKRRKKTPSDEGAKVEVKKEEMAELDFTYAGILRYVMETLAKCGEGSTLNAMRKTCTVMRKIHNENRNIYIDIAPSRLFLEDEDRIFKHALTHELHRTDGPAIERKNGAKGWYQNGLCHRENGPALEWEYGKKCWYRHGKCHRETGPAIEDPGVAKEWWLNNELHREGMPAIEFEDGGEQWYRNGKCHREDGPAIKCASGHEERWIDGVRQVAPAR